MRAPGGWSFYAIGSPAPQGSKRHVGGGRMVESSQAVKPWRDSVTAAGFGAGPCLDGPLAVAMVFTVARPKSAPRREHTPYRTPDLSKVCRATEDAVTVAGLWADDARVASYRPLAKVWPGTGDVSDLALPVPGVVVAAVELTGRLADDLEALHGLACQALVGRVGHSQPPTGRRRRGLT